MEVSVLCSGAECSHFLLCARSARRRLGGGKVAIRRGLGLQAQPFEPTALATAQGPQGPCFSPPENKKIGHPRVAYFLVSWRREGESGQKI